MRGFCYFYLVNFFDKVPLAISTDYKINNTLSRSSVADVYEQIKKDLTDAEDLLPDDYTGSYRTHPNKSVAAALLSRVFLYLGDWGRAEDKATILLANTDDYNLSPDLNTVFLPGSKEAIWQFQPIDGLGYTWEGNYWLGPTSGPRINVLRKEDLLAFDSADNRKLNWITSVVSAGDTTYLPFKYKEFVPSLLPDEYAVVLRLAELYLIRAEARLKQDKRSIAIADVDKVRERAGLPLLQNTNPGISKDSLMLVIEQERRKEFLAEWGHRWLDLKRWGKAVTMLSALKPGFTADDLIYPIPFNEITKNPNLHQ
jgi:hypothetical protein